MTPQEDPQLIRDLVQKMREDIVGAIDRNLSLAPATSHYFSLTLMAGVVALTYISAVLRRFGAQETLHLTEKELAQFAGLALAHITTIMDHNDVEIDEQDAFEQAYGAIRLLREAREKGAHLS